MFGTVWCGFVGVSLCCVCDSLMCVSGSESVLYLGVFCGFLGVRFCCAWDSLLWVLGSVFVLCLGQLDVGLWG